MFNFSLINLNEELINFWLPALLPVAPIYIWLRPRIKLLILKDKKGNLFSLFFFTAWIIISTPTIILQEYSLTASGKLTSIQSIDQISLKPLTKYYKIKNHYIDKQHIAIHRRTEVSGRNSEYLTFYLYVACPILNNGPQTDNMIKPPVAWLGVEYTKGISNHSNDAEKERAFKELGKEAEDKFKKENLDQFIYLDRIGNSTERKGYNAAIQTIPGYQDTNSIILKAKNEPFEARNGDKLEWVFMSFCIGAGIWLIMLIFPKLDKGWMQKLSDHNSKEQGRSIIKAISLMKIDGNASVSLGIIALNILVFIVMVFAGLGVISFDGQDLYTWGANYRPAVIDNGQWWRLLTNIFLHGGLMHLLFNMYGLLFVSVFLNPVLGNVKLLIAYITCGVLASLTSIWWHPATLSVGASGAIFGLYGISTALLTTNKVEKSSRKGLLIYNLIFIGINLIMGFTGGIDNAAHIGGLLSGLIIGYIYYFFIETPKPKRKYKRKAKSSEIE